MITVPMYGFGSGVMLNFKITPYATEDLLQAASPMKNTLGIVTTEAVTGWVIDAIKPEEPVAGTVYFPNLTSGSTKINALKRNVINMYPGAAQQFINGAWVDLPSYVYDEEWKPLVAKMYLYKAGDECTDITGGYVSIKKSPYSGVNGYAPTVTRNSDNMYMVQNHSYNGGIVYAQKEIDLTVYRELVFDGKIFSSQGAEQCRLAVWTSIGEYARDNIVAEMQADNNDGVRSLPISNLTGKHIVGFYMHTSDGADSSVTMKNLFLQ